MAIEGEYELVQCQETFKGEANFIKIKKVPENIYLLFENSYWYQFQLPTALAAKSVTRDIAIDILRQNVRKCLSDAEQKFKK